MKYILQNISELLNYRIEQYELIKGHPMLLIFTYFVNFWFGHEPFGFPDVAICCVQNSF